MESMYKLLGIHKPSEKTKDNVDKSKKTDHEVLKGRFKIQKSDNDKHLAFGWASIAIDEAGEQLVDWQEDMIDPEDLENAASAFVRIYREGGEMHERGDCAVLIESVVFTEEKMEAMGIPVGTIPVGWWIGFLVTDEEVWEKVKDGTYTMFSIEGEAERVEVEEDGDSD